MNNEDITAEGNPYVEIAKRAGILCKADLTTNSVIEMPELQGIIGYHLALADGEWTATALAIKEHYLPKSEDDELPKSIAGIALAIADRIDTIAGFWWLGRKPTGQKDPYAIRRQAIAVIRIIIEKKLKLDLRDLLKESTETYRSKNIDVNTDIIEEILDFFFERLRVMYKEKGKDSKIIESSLHSRHANFYDIDCRIDALNTFITLPISDILIDTYRRAKNITKNIKEKPLLPTIQSLDKKEESLLRDILWTINVTDDMLSKNYYPGMLIIHGILAENLNIWLEDFDYKNANEQKINTRASFCQMFIKIVNHIYSIDCLL